MCGAVEVILLETVHCELCGCVYGHGRQHEQQREGHHQAVGHAAPQHLHQVLIRPHPATPTTLTKSLITPPTAVLEPSRRQEPFAWAAFTRSWMEKLLCGRLWGLISQVESRVPGGLSDASPSRRIYKVKEYYEHVARKKQKSIA